MAENVANMGPVYKVTVSHAMKMVERLASNPLGNTVIITSADAVGRSNGAVHTFGMIP